MTKYLLTTPCSISYVSLFHFIELFTWNVQGKTFQMRQPMNPRVFIYSLGNDICWWQMTWHVLQPSVTEKSPHVLGLRLHRIHSVYWHWIFCLKVCYWRRLDLLVVIFFRSTMKVSDVFGSSLSSLQFSQQLHLSTCMCDGSWRWETYIHDIFQLFNESAITPDSLLISSKIPDCRNFHIRNPSWECRGDVRSNIMWVLIFSSY